MNIVYTIAGTYRAAGMERVLADKANWFAAHGHTVTVVTTEQKGRADAFAMDPAIRHIDLGIGYEDNNGRSLWSKVLCYPFKQWKHRRRLTRVLERVRPDVTVSMFCNDEAFLPRIQDGSRKVLEVHFSRFKRLQYGRSGLWAIVDRLRSRSDLRHIRRFDRFVVLTREDRGYWGALENIAVIPNPLSSRPDRPSGLTAKTVVAVGRLSWQKGLERLVEAWHIVHPQAPEWKLSLIGDGEMRETLAAQVRRLGLGDSVEMPGVLHDMDAVYRDASILALTSRYEGLPMVLLEAQSYGVPAVSFDCRCGPKDVIRSGENGLLVPEGDIEGFARALLQLIQSPEALKRIGAAAYADAVRWDRETIMQQWINLFESILSSRR